VSIAAIFTKFSQLILRKIIKIVDTRCQILRLKCTKFDFAGGAYSAPPDPLAAFKGPTSKGRRGARGGKGRGREGREWRGRGGMGRGLIRASIRSPTLLAVSLSFFSR